MAENRQNLNQTTNEYDDDDPTSYMQLMYEQAAESDTVERVRRAISRTADAAQNFAGRMARSVDQGQ